MKIKVTISLKDLRDKGACDNGIEWFKKNYLGKKRSAEVEFTSEDFARLMQTRQLNRGDAWPHAAFADWAFNEGVLPSPPVEGFRFRGNTMVKNARLSGCTFSRRKETFAVPVKGSTLRNCTFNFEAGEDDGADRNWISAENSNLVSCELVGRFSLHCHEHSIVANCSFKGAVLNHPCVLFCKVTNSVFNGASLKSSEFRSSEFLSCDFTGANLTDAQFIYCNLCESDFTGADLKWARFRHCAGLSPDTVAHACEAGADLSYSEVVGGESELRDVRRRLGKAGYKLDYQTIVRK